MHLANQALFIDIVSLLWAFHIKNPTYLNGKPILFIEDAIAAHGIVMFVRLLIGHTGILTAIFLRVTANLNLSIASFNLGSLTCTAFWRWNSPGGCRTAGHEREKSRTYQALISDATRLPRVTADDQIFLTWPGSH